MKYVAKVDSDNYLFSLSKDEILILMFGELRPQYNPDKKQEVSEFEGKLNYGKIEEVSFEKKISRLMDFYDTAKRSDGWEGLSNKMEEIKKMFEPVKEYMEKFKDIKS